MATTAAVVGILSALATTASSISSMSQGGGGGKTPSPQPFDTRQMSRAILPGAKADAAARVGGGMSPDFLSNLVSQQVGEPGAGLGILEEIRGSLGGGQAP